MKLSSILNPRLIYFNIPGNDRQPIYQYLLKESLPELGIDLPPEEMCREIISREDSIKIPYERGAAIPHLRRPELQDLHIIIGILAKPIMLKECDQTESKIIIMSLISENTAETYLKALAAFSRYLLRDDGGTEKLIACKNPEDILEVLEADDVWIKKLITAEDIMATESPSIRIGTCLSEALDIFTLNNRIQLPVIDDQGTLVGTLDASTIIQRSIPKQVLMMDNLKFYTSFETFEKLLNEESDLLIDEFVKEAEAVIKPETPLIQLTVTLAREEARNLFVVDNDNHLLGVITIQEIINKVLRG